MKPNGQTQPHIAFPINMPTIRNEATASHGKTALYNVSCMAVKASPTAFCCSPHVHKTGNRRGKVPMLNITALKIMKDRNWIIFRSVSNLNMTSFISRFNFQPLSCVNEKPSYLFSDYFNVFHTNPRRN